MSEVQNQNASLTLIAGEDLSALQHRFCVMSANNQIAVSTIFPTLTALGITQNKPGSGYEASVAIIGAVAKIELGATLSAGAIVSPAAATGKAIAVAATYYPAAMLLNGGDDGDVVDCIILSNSIPRAA